MASKRQTFVLSDERVNAYGFRVLTAGIDTSYFESNPVGYWNHRFSDSYKEDALLPMFRWENLRKENGRLLGDLVADEQDEEAMKIMGKIERGFINACSITFDPLATSDAPEDMVAGQMRATVTKSLLLEASPVGMPGNGGALKLRNASGQTISLSTGSDNAGLDALLPKISLKQPIASMKTTLISLAAALGMSKPDEATDEAVVQEVARLKRLNGEQAAQLTSLQAEVKTLNESRVKSLVDNAKTAGLIADDEVAHYEKLAAADYESTAAILAVRKPTEQKPTQSLSQVLAAGAASAASKAGNPGDDLCEFDKLSRNNPRELERIRTTEPERFEKLKAEKLNRITK